MASAVVIPVGIIVLIIAILVVVNPGTKTANAHVIAGDLNHTDASGTDDYMNARDELIHSEQKMRIGGMLTLNDKEKIVNDLMMKEKRNIMDGARDRRLRYFSAASFYDSKSLMETTSIFKIIKKMPKGASLHLHDLACSSLEWVVKNATYRENVYMCVNGDNFITFKVAASNPGGNCKLVKDARAAAPDVKEFDLSLIKNVSLLASDPLITYPTVNKVWDRFNIYFQQVIDLLFYVPNMRDCFRRCLEEFKADNVQYLEMRSLMSGFFDLDGTKHDAEYGLKLFKEVADQFAKDNPDFSGAKMIMSSMRILPEADIANEVKIAMKLHRDYPDFMMGFDLVGQEDPNHSLLEYIDALLYPSRQTPPVKLPYFFHSAETKWQGTEVDYNLVDAVLLNTTRIGHGYGLAKHPKLSQLVKERGIAVEVNPISNQLLGLVSDLRNHGTIPLIADNFPIVIGSDDPATWESLPLSHDYFVAFMDMTGEDNDLRFLKQLAINSLQYSTMTDSEKDEAFKLWESKWDKFIQECVDAMDPQPMKT